MKLISRVVLSVAFLIVSLVSTQASAFDMGDGVWTGMTMAQVMKASSIKFSYFGEVKKCDMYQINDLASVVLVSQCSKRVLGKRFIKGAPEVWEDLLKLGRQPLTPKGDVKDLVVVKDRDIRMVYKFEEKKLQYVVTIVSKRLMDRFYTDCHGKTGGYPY